MLRVDVGHATAQRAAGSDLDLDLIRVDPGAEHCRAVRGRQRRTTALPCDRWLAIPRRLIVGERDLASGRVCLRDAGCFRAAAEEEPEMPRGDPRARVRGLEHD